MLHSSAGQSVSSCFCLAYAKNDVKNAHRKPNREKCKKLCFFCRLPFKIYRINWHCSWSSTKTTHAQLFDARRRRSTVGNLSILKCTRSTVHCVDDVVAHFSRVSDSLTQFGRNQPKAVFTSVNIQWRDYVMHNRNERPTKKKQLKTIDNVDWIMFCVQNNCTNRMKMMTTKKKQTKKKRKTGAHFCRYIKRNELLPPPQRKNSFRLSFSLVRFCIFQPNSGERIVFSFE